MYLLAEILIYRNTFTAVFDIENNRYLNKDMVVQDRGHGVKSRQHANC